MELKPLSARWPPPACSPSAVAGALSVRRSSAARRDRAHAHHRDRDGGDGSRSARSDPARALPNYREIVQAYGPAVRRHHRAGAHKVEGPAGPWTSPADPVLSSSRACPACRPAPRETCVPWARLGLHHQFRRPDPDQRHVVPRTPKDVRFQAVPTAASSGQGAPASDAPTDTSRC